MIRSGGKDVCTPSKIPLREKLFFRMVQTRPAIFLFNAGLIGLAGGILGVILGDHPVWSIAVLDGRPARQGLMFL